MLQFDEYKVKLNNLAPTLEELGKALDLESAERELDMLQAESAADGFWNNLEKAQKVQQRIKNLQDKVDKQNKRRREWDDLMALCERTNPCCPSLRRASPSWSGTWRRRAYRPCSLGSMTAPM